MLNYATLQRLFSVIDYTKPEVRGRGATAHQAHQFRAFARGAGLLRGAFARGAARVVCWRGCDVARELVLCVFGDDQPSIVAECVDGPLSHVVRIARLTESESGER